MKVKRSLKVFLCVLLFSPMWLVAEEIIQGRYCYNFGDNETLLEAREMTRTLAIRNAIESYRVFVEAASLIDNFILSTDLVQTISSGYLKDMQVLEHTEEKYTVCETVQFKIDPVTFDTFLKSHVQRRLRMAREMGIDNKYLKILSLSPFKFNASGEKVVEVVAKVLHATGRLDSAKFRVTKPQFKICITWYNRAGEPLDGDSRYIHTGAEGLTAGEIKKVEFKNPPLDAVSFRVWLVK